jgi:hypothetical protein
MQTLLDHNITRIITREILWIWIVNVSNKTNIEVISLVYTVHIMQHENKAMVISSFEQSLAANELLPTCIPAAHLAALHRVSQPLLAREYIDCTHRLEVAGQKLTNYLALWAMIITIEEVFSLPDSLANKRSLKNIVLTLLQRSK